MKQTVIVTGVMVAALIVALPVARAQKGVGDPIGLARQAVQPEIVSLEGTLIEVKTGPCESTTGRALVGTHLILETDKQEPLNIHLGPADAVEEMVAKLKVGEPVAVKAFRTEKMKEHHYVAQSLAIGESTIQLRDENLRPVWAGGGNRTQRQTDVGYPRRGDRPGWSRAGRGWGRGRGRRGTW